jgi:hypothetical protein
MLLVQEKKVKDEGTIKEKFIANHFENLQFVGLILAFFARLPRIACPFIDFHPLFILSHFSAHISSSPN